MAVGTKILINDSKVDQKGTLTLCGCNQINSTGSLVYLTDQTQDYNCLSVPHVGYVTGITSGVLTCLNSCFYNKTEINKYTGDTDNRLTDIESITNVAVTGASNGITKIDSHNIELGGSLTKNTTISGSYGFGVNSNTIKFSGVTSGVEIGGSGLYLTANIPGSGGLLCLGGSGEVCQTSLAAFGGITGGTNGIVDCGNQNVGLGGVLSSSTTICGDGNNLSLGSAGSKLGLLTINSSENIGINSDKNLQISISGGTITTSDGMGLRYSSDYSDTFVDNSLITKRYVDNIVYGIDPKSAVLVATTANIDELIDIKTIDGISLTGGDRILVKDQDDKTENGIYIVNDGNWYRANDFDGTPSGEVTQGALIPVITGNTNANTLWILTSKDPITIDVDELIFTKFSQLIDVSSGNGIDISTVGAVKTISVDLADNSGLCFSSSELTINSSIAGSGLCWKNGVINVDVPTGGTTGVPVKFDDSYDLIVETSAINNVLGGVLSGSTNGLTDNNGIVCLGGQLITSTVICGNDVCGLTYQDTAITNKRGIQYADDYSATFVARSLVDAGFVTGLTSTSGIQTACNGLTKEGNVVVLGGTLTGNTEIDVDSYEFTICNSNSCVTIQDGYAELGTDSGETAVMLGSGSFDVAAGINVGVHGNCSGAMLIYACDVVMELCNSLNYFSVYNNCNQNLILNGNNDIVCLSNCDSNLTICGSDNLIELNACNSSIKLSEDYMCFLLENSDCLVINNSSTIFTSINGTGIEYGDCYHDTYTSRSLVDKEYVDNIKVNADNGLSVSGGTIILGGTLTGNTTIDINNGNLLVTDGAGNFGADIATTYVQLGDINGVCGHLYVDDCGSFICMRNATGTTYGEFCFDSTTINGFVSDSIDIGSLNLTKSCYQIDVACGSNVIREQMLASLPKYIVYVCGSNKQMFAAAPKTPPMACCGAIYATSAGAGVSFGNGSITSIHSTALGNAKVAVENVMVDVCGESSSESINITTDCVGSTQYIDLDYPTNLITIESTCVNVGLGSTTNILIDGNADSILVNTTGVKLCLQQSGGNIFTDTVNSKGLEYAEDYSINFTDRSLVDKAYVDGAVVSGTSLIYACNGLTKVDNTIALGGTLTGDTWICIPSDACFAFGDATTVNTNIQIIRTSGNESINMYTNGTTFWSDLYLHDGNSALRYYDCNAVTTSELVVEPNRAKMIVNDGNSEIDVDINYIQLGYYGTGNNEIYLDSAGISFLSDTAIILGDASYYNSQVFICAPITSGSTSDQVIVRDSSTGELKTVAGSSLGDKNNIYAMTVITTSTDLTTESTYVQIVNSPSASITVTLPATPIDGQVFRIKDGGNNAVNFPITIAPNGNLIDNAENNATLNTDGGALELVYNNELGSWFVFSFVN